MITEDYVSFEIAKLLREKGFKGSKKMFYNERQSLEAFHNYWWRITPRERYDCLEAPTFWEVMKWLREKHRCFIGICPELNEILIDGNHTGLYENIQYSYNIGVWGESGWHELPEEQFYYKTYTTYEETVSAAIKYCLENLV